MALLNCSFLWVWGCCCSSAIKSKKDIFQSRLVRWGNLGITRHFDEAGQDYQQRVRMNGFWRHLWKQPSSGVEDRLDMFQGPTIWYSSRLRRQLKISSIMVSFKIDESRVMSFDVCIYDTFQDWKIIYVPKGSNSNVAFLRIFTIRKREAMHTHE